MVTGDDGYDFDWWELWPLSERTRRPVAWTRSSIILTAHARQPVVEAHLFPSGKAVLIPNPPPLFEPYGAYKPPSIITVSPCDEWVFAFFPHQNAGGLSCLWKRGDELDRWAVNDYWTCTTNVVTSAWLGGPREWVVVGSLNASIRLPLRGPPMPLSEPTLLLVTQSHELHICYFKFKQSLKIHRVSLLEASSSGVSSSLQGDSDTFVDSLAAGGISICVAAAIGLGYNETSVFVAMRSQTAFTGPRIHYDLNESFQQVPAFTDLPSVDWEPWSEESSIVMCEIKMSSNGLDLTIAVHPLPSIHYDNSLTDLAFVAVPGDCRRHGDDLVWQPGTAVMHLLAASCDTSDGSSTPTSNVTLFSIVKQGNSAWTAEFVAHRTFDTRAVAFMVALPPITFTGDEQPSSTSDVAAQTMCTVAAGLLNTTKTLFPPKTPRRRQEVRAELVVLSLKDLSDQPQWRSCKLISGISSAGANLPLSVVPSPNGVLLCSVDSSSLLQHRTSLHPLPRWQTVSDAATLASFLVACIRARRTPSDIVHVLSLPETPIQDVQTTLSQALSFFDSGHSKDAPNTWMRDVIGAAVEVYRTRATRAREHREKKGLTAQWKMAHDICSAIACTTIFEGLRRADGVYHLAGVWQLINVATWSINFIEHLVKECITQGDITRKEAVNKTKHDDEENLFGSVSPTPTRENPATRISLLDAAADAAAEPSSPLLHLVHPYPLTNLQTLLSHVRNLHLQVASSSASTEGAKIAQDILVDLIACSGVDFNKFDALLSEVAVEVKKLSSQLMLQSLAACRIVPELYTSVAPILVKIADSPAIDRTRLFVKSADLVDGFSDLRISDNQDGWADVVTKDELSGLAALQLSLCVRCGGRSRGALAGALVCICGGQWIGAS